MPKGVFALILAAAVLSDPAFAASSKTVTRTFEECHALAVSRGVHPKKRPQRYETLKGFGQKTNPEGLIARCMAGKL